MDPAKARDFLGRLGKGGKGAGSGLGVLGAAAALGYGIYKSMYTGKEAGMPARCTNIERSRSNFTYKFGTKIVNHVLLVFLL